MPQKQQQWQNDGAKKIFCLLHGKNATHDTNDCRTLKRQAEEQKKSRGNNRDDKHNSKKKGYNPNKEEVNMLVQFAKNAMKKDTNKELKKFESISVSDKSSEWKTGSGAAKILIILQQIAQN